MPEKKKICEIMDNIMERACDATMPRLSGKVKRRESTYWWNNEIDKKRKECNSIRRKWKRMRKRESEAMREEEYRRVKKELRIMIRKAKESAWKALIRTIDEDPWGLPYRLVLARLRRNSPTLTEILEPDTVDRMIEKLFPPSKRNKSELQLQEEDWNEDWNITAMEVYRVTKKRKAANTAPGMDGLKFAYWKQINGEMTELVAQVLTICVKEGIFPVTWKQAQLILIPKGELQLENSKVRPICLLAESGKILERILVERMWHWMQEHEKAKLHPSQFGFCKQRSTTDAIVELKEFIEFAHKEDATVIAISIDIQNAFNSLQWTEIVDALKERVPYIHSKNNVQLLVAKDD